jgi:hypothetical protein
VLRRRLHRRRKRDGALGLALGGAEGSPLPLRRSPGEGAAHPAPQGVERVRRARQHLQDREKPVEKPDPACQLGQGWSPKGYKLSQGWPPKGYRLRQGWPPKGYQLSQGSPPKVYKLSQGRPPKGYKLSQGWSPKDRLYKH